MGTHVSRGTDTKTGEERQINNVHIFLFDADGNYLEASNEGRDAFQGYRRLDNGGTNWILQTSLFDRQDLAGNATVYVLANVPEGYFADTDNDGRPDDVEDMADLEAMAIELPEFTTDIPEGGLPMVLKRTGVDLSDDAQSKIVTLQLRSMMARIDLNFTMNPLQGTVWNLPSLEFHAMRVGNFPKGGKVKSQLVNMEDGTTGTGETTEVEGYGLTNLELTDSPILNRVLRSGSEQSVTFYMFEHARTAKSLEEVVDEERNQIFPGGNYPDSIAVPLEGNASHAYLLLAGSTNHMQCRIANGTVRVRYADGTETCVTLTNPDNWCPIEQDFYVDGLAFDVPGPRPYRLHLKSGKVSRDLGKELGISGVYGREIEGGAGVLLDIPLDKAKELESLTLETVANDVVIGLMGVTLQE